MRQLFVLRLIMEKRPMGVEPTSWAWRAQVIPLYDGRTWMRQTIAARIEKVNPETVSPGALAPSCAPAEAERGW